MHTDIRRWSRDLVQGLGDDPTNAVVNALGGLHNGLFYSITSRYPLGTNVFDREWDLLVVLDACRVDALREVAPEFDFIGDVGSIWSVGSSSHEWLCKTFTREHLPEIRGTIHLSANPHVGPTFEDGVYPPQSYAIPLMLADWDVVDDRDFELLEMLLDSEYENVATVAPDELTDRAIRAGRDHEFERMVVHYFQPHRPYIGDAYADRRPLTDVEDQPWEAIRDGRASREEVWELYLENLRLVLRSVDRLLENVDADTVAITADHGDLFGEFGQYGHPEGFVHPNLKKVPWVETTASDERTSEPTVEGERAEPGTDAEDRLRDLGYL